MSDKHTIVCETDHYKNSGFSQHFFLMDLDTNLIIDPLDYPAHWKNNKYKIISYRLISNHNEMENHIVDEIISRAKKYLGIDAGSRINKAEDEKIAEKIKEVVLRKEELEKTNQTLEDVLEETSEALSKTQKKFKEEVESLIVQYNDKAKQVNIQSDIIAKRREEYDEVIRENEKLRDEMTRLESIQGRDAENTKAIDALKFFLSVIFKK
jgi:hypothetical protein